MRCRICSISTHQLLGGVTHYCTSESIKCLKAGCWEDYPFKSQRDHQKEEEHYGNNIRGSLKKGCATVRSHDSLLKPQQHSLKSTQLSTVMRRYLRIPANECADLRTRNLPLQRTHRGIRCNEKATVGRCPQTETNSYRKDSSNAVRGPSTLSHRQHCCPFVEMHASRPSSAAIERSPTDATIMQRANLTTVP